MDETINPIKVKQVLTRVRAKSLARFDFANVIDTEILQNEIHHTIIPATTTAKTRNFNFRTVTPNCAVTVEFDDKTLTT
jgi:hypothetical protein